jgi:hypothetical protein
MVVGNKCFGGHAAAIFRVEVHGQDGTALLVSSHHTTQYNNPENHDLFFTATKTRNHTSETYVWVGNNAVSTSQQSLSTLKMEAAQHPKHWFLTTVLHGTTTHEITYIITSMKTSNYTAWSLFVLLSQT